MCLGVHLFKLDQTNHQSYEYCEHLNHHWKKSPAMHQTHCLQPPKASKSTLSSSYATCTQIRKGCCRCGPLVMPFGPKAHPALATSKASLPLAVVPSKTRTDYSLMLGVAFFFLLLPVRNLFVTCHCASRKSFNLVVWRSWRKNDTSRLSLEINNAIIL